MQSCCSAKITKYGAEIRGDEQKSFDLKVLIKNKFPVSQPSFSGECQRGDVDVVVLPCRLATLCFLKLTFT